MPLTITRVLYSACFDKDVYYRRLFTFIDECSSEPLLHIVLFVIKYVYNADSLSLLEFTVSNGVKQGGVLTGTILHLYIYIHRVRKKGATSFFAITLPYPNRSSKFFYRHT